MRRRRGGRRPRPRPGRGVCTSTGAAAARRGGQRRRRAGRRRPRRSGTGRTTGGPAERAGRRSAGRPQPASRRPGSAGCAGRVWRPGRRPGSGRGCRGGRCGWSWGVDRVMQDCGPHLMATDGLRESVYGPVMTGRFPILYIAEAGAQDAVLSSGVLAYLVGAMPQARFTVVGSPASAPLFADTPRLDRLIVLEKESRLDWFGLWTQVRSTNWGLVVDIRGSGLSGRLKRQKRAVRGEREPGVHAVELAARVLQLDEIPAPRLFVSDATQAAADALIPP